LPIYGLTLTNKIRINHFTIYPKFRIDFEDFFVKYTLYPYSIEDSLDEDKYYEIRNKKKQYLNLFSEHTLLAFPFEINYEKYINCNYEYEMNVLEHLCDYAEIILDIIRYYECNYNDKFNSLTSPGYCNDGFSTSLIFMNKLNSFRIHAGQVLNFAPTVEARITLSKVREVENNVLTKLDCNETGNIARNALYLNSSIINANSNNSKIVQILQLIDFLMLPYEYGSFKKIKGNFICHIAQNKKDYHTLSERFRELTDTNGLRTKILHGGKNIEEILSYTEINNLFNELHGYIKINIDAMISNYNIKFIDFQQIRDNIKNTFI
jgi:hypothetical protein